MQPTEKQAERIAAVRQIFEDYDLSNIELLASWEGDDLADLRKFMTPEEYQTLLDQLEPSPEV
jgi:hypothetical protein